MALQGQTVLLAAGIESPITAWDLQTGTQLTSYKANACPRNGMCLLGRDYLLACQTNKDALHCYAWHKDQVLQRSFCAEKISAVAASQDGSYVAGGGVSGMLYLWEAGSGRLLRTWAAHYKGVTALSFVDGPGGVLASGGEDTLVMVWLLPDLLDVAQDTSAPSYSRPQPMHSWSDHTLPVTALAPGPLSSSGGCSGVVASASLDHSVKLHSLADGRVLRSVALPAPLTALALDAGGQCLYAGGGDGRIFEVSLIGDLPGQPQGGSRGKASGGSSGDGADGGYHVLAGHSRTVNSLCLSLDGEMLVSGSDDGSAKAWDLRSRQPVLTLPGPNNKLPVTSVIVMAQPPHLVAGAGAGGGSSASGSTAGGSGGRAGPKRPQPLAAFAKYAGQAGSLKPWEGAPVVLDGTLLPATASSSSSSNLVAAAAVGPSAACWDSLILGLLNPGSGICVDAPGTSGSGSGADWTGGQQGAPAAPPSAAGKKGKHQQQQQQQEAAAAATASGDAAGGDGVAVAELQAEVAALKAALEATRAEASKWAQLHGQLQQRVVNNARKG